MLATQETHDFFNILIKKALYGYILTVKSEKRSVIQLNVKRGDIFYADLSPVVGSEQGGLRPVLIIQNDVGNRHSPTVIAAAITSQLSKAHLPTHIGVYADQYGLSKDSVILLEQVRTLDKRRLREKIGHLDAQMMGVVNQAISVSFGLPSDDTPTVATPGRLSPTPHTSPQPATQPYPPAAAAVSSVSHSTAGQIHTNAPHNTTSHVSATDIQTMHTAQTPDPTHKTGQTP